MKRIVKLGFFGAVDYALLQLTVPAAGLGITPVVMRPDLPAAGEQIFCIHHPEGAVKRLSAKHGAFKTVISSDLNAVVADLDVASGSIGAGLFDASGKVVGVMSTGTPCNIAFYPTAGALADIGNPQDDPAGRDVMIVFDRSGSMGSMPAPDGPRSRRRATPPRYSSSWCRATAQSDRPGVVQYRGEQSDRFRAAAGQCRQQTGADRAGAVHRRDRRRNRRRRHH